ncbi:heavy metal sensor histidine kinase [Viridibacterium curvum]|uniref:Sensor protein n=1 Tax=Viridibacterium curvum TaxID=1101404 RepID=A0ABP9QBC1_9RHOO
MSLLQPARRPSLSLRLTLFFAAASTAVLLALGYMILRAVDRHFMEQDAALLEGKIALAQHALRSARSVADLAALPQKFDDSLIGHHGLVVAVIAADGSRLFASRDMQVPESLLAPEAALPEAEFEHLAHAGHAANIRTAQLSAWQTSAGNFRGLAVAMHTGVASMAPVTLIVATEISHHTDFLREFRVTLWVFVACAALLTGLLGWLLTRHALLPLQAMRRTAAEVTADNLHFRLPLADVPKELATLAESLNQMLARLEDSFRRLSDFSSDLAHELRTPVSNLMTHTQVALSQTRSAEEYRDVLYSNLEEFERLSSMVSELLFLAKADNGLMVPRHELVRLEDEMRKLFDFYEALAESAQLTLQVEGQGAVPGDGSMLRRALSNLLSNAVRHATPGTAIVVRIDDSDGTHVQLEIENQGETIAPEHLPRLFDRFYRADASRHRSSEGAGLGLAITHAIVVAHGGSLAVTSEDGVTRFTMRLPAPRP